MDDKLKPSKEKRKFPRLSMYLPLEYQVIDIPYVHKGSIANASNEGFLIYSTEKIPVSTRLNIVVLFPKGFELNNFKVVAEIVWGQPSAGIDQDKYQYGLKFVHISNEELKRLKRLLSGRLQKVANGIDSSSKGVEMRRHPRIAFDSPVEYCRINSPIKLSGRALNISERGLEVSLRERVEIGQRLKLSVFTGSRSSSDTVDMTVQVVWLDVHMGEGWGDYQCGVKITDISPEEGKRLEGFIETLSRSESRQNSSGNKTGLQNVEASHLTSVR